MQIQDSEVSNFNYDPYMGCDIVATMKHIYQRMQDRIKEVAELEKTHELTQVWLMSKEQYDKLPENPTWYDCLAAGAIPQGSIWVEKDKSHRLGNDSAMDAGLQE